MLVEPPEVFRPLHAPRLAMPAEHFQKEAGKEGSTARQRGGRRRPRVSRSGLFLLRDECALRRRRSALDVFLDPPEKVGAFGGATRRRLQRRARTANQLCATAADPHFLRFAQHAAPSIAPAQEHGDMTRRLCAQLARTLTRPSIPRHSDVLSPRLLGSRALTMGVRGHYPIITSLIGPHTSPAPRALDASPCTQALPRDWPRRSASQPAPRTFFERPLWGQVPLLWRRHGQRRCERARGS
jgi:hypothetical protein